MNYLDCSILETLWLLKRASAEGPESEANYINRALELIPFIEIGSEENLFEFSLKIESRFDYIDNIGKIGSTTY